MCPHRKPECAQPKFMHQKNAWTRDKSRAVHVNDRIISVDDIVYGYEKLNEADEMYSKTTFQGVAMQQNPIDALAIADLLWRVRPRLLIELGTAGGGSALFYAKAMLAYDPLAKVLTMDPSRQASPLVDWNAKGMRQHCPHCTSASHSAIWERSVTFLRMFPTSKSARGLAARLAKETVEAGYPVFVIEVALPSLKRPVRWGDTHGWAGLDAMSPGPGAPSPAWRHTA